MNTYGLTDTRVAVIGLGYVGLPLAVEFGKQYDTVGFDISPLRIEELRNALDSTREVEAKELRRATRLRLTDDPDALATANVYVVTVPTPVDAARKPVLTLLQNASATVGRHLKRGDIVIYESTVYPGATEEVCAPVLERTSGLRLNDGFYLGYSPERINPGDKKHRLTTICKITSGSTPEVADFVDALYRTIIPAGTHKVSSIKVAEAAKIIENTQRDLNIALVNELALICNKLAIDTNEVLDAASTKWNFLPFRPGLVGGHCIGVDPYYLTHKAQEVGLHPAVILAGRRINDSMGAYVAGQVAKLMARNRLHLAGGRVLILGMTFKENCPDVRNSRVIDVVRELETYGADVDVYDPHGDPEQTQREHGVSLLNQPASGAYDAAIVAVAHEHFREMSPASVRSLLKEGGILYDIKGIYPAHAVDGRL
ncbi:Vi polysaccharide biosynthesis protein VipA/TviB [Alkalilimnicola ehrlichii]|uniref:Vi polysaccharide biosynthesis protein VipA/TviB n=1 Tax=Alkalilimnicola ehrlichii TaxID=351052 RepID=A0A3E0WNR3_9GAMM|nr:nucleotide sugar dehydrogenase [Alkalilimnicola ehrlichii]RFA27957.1 Vi polysaccharide biosynthesis protein VipA/TviB [Alkalilimnicola ehrlichii]RFA34604.1 Vi polysaccharide biosynthesis protein VipA/TviB [Alkalilimnicola ehrlichii]